MSDPTPPTEQPAGLPPRSAAFQRFMAAPLVFALLLVGATGLLFVLALVGGEAEGDRAEIVFDACPDALPLMRARAEAIGLGEPVWEDAGGALTLRATMPGLDDDAEAVPAFLAAPGQLELQRGADRLATTGDVTVAQLRLDESGLAYTWIELDEEPLARVIAAVEADSGGMIDVVMDGELLAQRPNTRAVADGGIRLLDEGEMDSRQRMRRAVDRATLLSHGPLPCPVTVRSVRPVAAP